MIRKKVGSDISICFFNLFANCCLVFRPLLTLHIVYLFMFLRRESFKLKLSYLSFLVCLYTANIGVLFNRKNFSGDKMNELPLFNERNTAYSST